MGGENPEDSTLSYDVPILNLSRYYIRSWLHAIRIPTAVKYPMAVSLKDNIVVAGGQLENGEDCQRTQKYDPVWRKWTTQAPMLETCHHGDAVVVADKMYVVGGRESRCMAYDPVADNWTILRPPQKVHCETSAVVYNGKILLCGGLNSEGVRTDLIEEYEPDEDVWKDWDVSLPKPMADLTVLPIRMNDLKLMYGFENIPEDDNDEEEDEEWVLEKECDPEEEEDSEEYETVDSSSEDSDNEESDGATNNN